MKKFRNIQFQDHVGALVVNDEKVLFKATDDNSKPLARSWRWAAIDKVQVMDPARGCTGRVIKLKSKNRAVSLTVPEFILEDLEQCLEMHLMASSSSSLGVESPHKIITKRRESNATKGSLPTTEAVEPTIKKKQSKSSTKEKIKAQPAASSSKQISDAKAKTKIETQVPEKVSQVSTDSHPSTPEKKQNSVGIQKKSSNTNASPKRSSTNLQHENPASPTNKKSNDKPADKNDKPADKNTSTGTSPKKKTMKLSTRDSRARKSISAPGVHKIENEGNTSSIEKKPSFGVTVNQQSSKNKDVIVEDTIPRNSLQEKSKKNDKHIVEDTIPRSSLRGDSRGGNSKKHQHQQSSTSMKKSLSPKAKRASMPGLIDNVKSKLMISPKKTKSEQEHEEELDPASHDSTSKRQSLMQKLGFNSSDKNRASNMLDPPEQHEKESEKQLPTKHNRHNRRVSSRNSTGSNNDKPKTQRPPLQFRKPPPRNRSFEEDFERSQRKLAIKQSKKEAKQQDKQKKATAASVRRDIPQSAPLKSHKQSNKTKNGNTLDSNDMIPDGSEHYQDIIFTPDRNSKPKMTKEMFKNNLSFHHDDAAATANLMDSFIFDAPPIKKESNHPDNNVSNDNSSTTSSSDDSSSTSSSSSSSSTSSTGSDDETKKTGKSRATRDAYNISNHEQASINFDDEDDELLSPQWDPHSAENKFRMMIYKHAAICQCTRSGDCEYDPVCYEHKVLLDHVEKCQDHETCENPKCRPAKEFLCMMQFMAGLEYEEDDNVYYAKKREFLVSIGKIAPISSIQIGGDDMGCSRRSIFSEGTWWSNVDAPRYDDEESI